VTQSPPTGRIAALIASPLEPEHVERIRAAEPRIEVLYAPELLPVPRYAADHHGTRRDLDAAAHERWSSLLARADIAFDFDWREPARMPLTAPRLRWVQATSSGIGEFLVKTGLAASDITFTTASGIHAAPLAEFAMLGLLYFLREVPMLARMKREHLWERFTSRSAEGSRVLVIGLGSVGRAVAAACRAFGMEVWGMRRSGPPVEGLAREITRSQLVEALGAVDAVVMACPLTPETRGLLGRREIEAMRPGAILVNVARGTVVDEPAMIEALAAGRLGGAALDVAAKEPLPQDSPLWDLENVVICPHSASTVAAENGRIVDIFLDNLSRFLDGRPLRNRFEADRGY
jgi:glyoxylate/hydroxypyruvate reductase A